MNARPLLIGITLMGALPLGLTAEGSPDESAVRHVVDEYVAGWRTGDVERLSEVFELDHGHIIWTQNDDGKSVIQSRTFRELLEKRKANPGYGEPYEILSLEVYDAVAFVTFRVERAPRGSYINHFTLHKVEDKWLVTTKTFVWRPASS